MSTRSHTVALATVFAIVCAGVIVGAQQQPSRASAQQTTDLLRRLDTGIATFRVSFDRAINRSRINGSQAETDINASVNDFKLATDRLRGRSRSRRAGAVEVEDVLQRARSIDIFLASHALDGAVERDWRNVRLNLDELARHNDIAWNWSDPADDVDTRRTARSNRLSGTYQLESAQSDDAERAVQQAMLALPAGQRQAASKRLMNRLNAPDTIAIDRSGNNVTMASSRGRQVTFEANGQARQEQGRGGRTMTTRATLNGEQLIVTTTGSGGDDFAVTFEPIDRGRNLRVTRSIHDDRLRRPVTVHSFYRKSSDDAEWNIESSDRRGSSRTESTGGEFAIPDATQLVATLDSALGTRNTNVEDRFTMTTRSPSQYEGAVIEGTISSVNASGRVSGRADMALDFDTIRLRNGRTFPFAGVIESVRMANGETIGVDNEGKVEEDSQTQKTVQRGAIGAALGAIIGAITGGGSGAAIGAAIGAGGGAGTVIAQGRDQLDLPRGTEFTITSSAAEGERASASGRRE